MIHTLEGRICQPALLAGMAGINEGEHPLCLGKICSRFECCLAELSAAAYDLKRLKLDPRKPRFKATRLGIRFD
jgi:hypothetical protein